MTIPGIRQKLHNYLEIADDKKVEAIFTILEEEIEESSIEYSDKLKKELDTRYEDLKSGKAKVISAKESKRRIEKIMDLSHNK